MRSRLLQTTHRGCPRCGRASRHRCEMRALAASVCSVAILLATATSLFSHNLSDGRLPNSIPTETEIRAALATAAAESGEEQSRRAALLEAYRRRTFAPLWFTAGQPTGQAVNLVSEL